MKKNVELNKYVEKKILTRLGIFAEFNKERNSDTDIYTRGEFIFSADEKDKKSAAAFLILLLDCIEKWAQAFRTYEDGKT